MSKNNEKDRLGAIIALLGLVHDELQKQSRQLRFVELALHQGAPRYKRPLAAYRHFDWSAIGAIVEESDGDGPTRVSHGGHIYTRRNGAGKFGEAIWYSRPTLEGKNEDGSNAYARLITFKDGPGTGLDDVEPLDGNVSHVAPAAPAGEEDEADDEADEVPDGAGELFSFCYGDGELVDQDNPTEVRAYTAYRRAHDEQPPTSKKALRQWHKARQGNGRQNGKSSQPTRSAA